MGVYFLLEPLPDFDSLAFLLLLPEETDLLSLRLLLTDEFPFGADCLDDLVVSDFRDCSDLVPLFCVCSVLLTLLSGITEGLRDTFPF
jgi:hypothetical protein